MSKIETRYDGANSNIDDYDDCEEECSHGRPETECWTCNPPPRRDPEEVAEERRAFGAEAASIKKLLVQAYGYDDDYAWQIAKRIVRSNCEHGDDVSGIYERCLDLSAEGKLDRLLDGGWGQLACEEAWIECYAERDPEDGGPRHNMSDDEMRRRMYEYLHKSRNYFDPANLAYKFGGVDAPMSPEEISDDVITRVRARLDKRRPTPDVPTKGSNSA